MRTHVLGFQSFFLGLLHHFVLVPLATCSIRVKVKRPMLLFWRLIVWAILSVKDADRMMVSAGDVLYQIALLEQSW